MNKDSKACIAYIAARAISGKLTTSVYDEERAAHINISGTVSATHAQVFDHIRGCHIQGHLMNLYDYGVGAHIKLNINGNTFSGYDYHSGVHFSGRVNGDNICISANGFSNYSI